MNNFKEDLVFFKGGDLVKIKHNIPNRPIMLVKHIVKARPNDSKSILLGVRCFWFDSNLAYNEQTFSSKDLVKVETEK